MGIASAFHTPLGAKTASASRPPQYYFLAIFASFHEDNSNRNDRGRQLALSAIWRIRRLAMW
jgi:hypothetical protein